MDSCDRLRDALGAAVGDAEPGLVAADRLCLACVELLGVDGAAISLVNAGATQGTFGSSGELSRRLDEFQFTFGEGPCLDAVRGARPVLVPDLRDPAERRWPAFAGAVMDAGVRAVYAFPVAIASLPMAALDLFSNAPGPLTGDGLTGGLLAAELATVPLLDLITGNVDWSTAGEGGHGWEQLASLERIEVYQATGMIMGRLDIGAAEALVRLRAHAFARGVTASELAWDVVERRVTLDSDGSWRSPDPASGAGA